MLDPGPQRARVEVLARRAVRSRKNYDTGEVEPGDFTDKQVEGWRKDLGDEVVDRLLGEQGAA